MLKGGNFVRDYGSRQEVVKLDDLSGTLLFQVKDKAYQQCLKRIIY